jgi:enoyl-CoA hydratase
MGEVHIEKRDRIAVLTLDNPPMNVLSAHMGEQIDAAIAEIASDDTVGAVILTGKGEKAFMAGADIKEFPRYMAENIAEDMMHRFDAMMSRLERLGKPTIAALNGITLGGGCELALSCDFRIAEEQIVIGLPEIKLGVFPGAGGTQRLPRLIGASRAKAMIFSGEAIDAAEALQIGLVNAVVPTGQALEAAIGFSARFVDKSLATLSRAKRAITEGLQLSLDEGVRNEAKLFAEAFATADAAEGVQAFIEKRKPVFKHR